MDFVSFNNTLSLTSIYSLEFDFGSNNFLHPVPRSCRTSGSEVLRMTPGLLLSRRKAQVYLLLTILFFHHLFIPRIIAMSGHQIQRYRSLQC